MPGVDRTRLHSQTWQTGNKWSIYRVELKGGTRVNENIQYIVNKTMYCLQYYTVLREFLYHDKGIYFLKVTSLWPIPLTIRMSLKKSSAYSLCPLDCHSTFSLVFHPCHSAYWLFILIFHSVTWPVVHFRLSLCNSAWLPFPSAFHSVTLPDCPFLPPFTL
jgi:hypothetical protein